MHTNDLDPHKTQSNFFVYIPAIYQRSLVTVVMYVQIHELLIRHQLILPTVVKSTAIIPLSPTYHLMLLYMAGYYDHKHCPKDLRRLDINYLK